MAGRLVNLTAVDARLPSTFVLDSGVVIDWLATYLFSSVGAEPVHLNQERMVWLVARLQNEGVNGVITSTSMAEIFHFILKLGYRRALGDHRSDLLIRYPNVKRHGWEHLFKARSDLITEFAATFDEARRLIVAAGIGFLQPDDLGPIQFGRSLEDELIRTMERYELDSSDAAILIEARRAGISAIATTDRDLHRARRDFDVYTWL